MSSTFPPPPPLSSSSSLARPDHFTLSSHQILVDKMKRQQEEKAKTEARSAVRAANKEAKEGVELATSDVKVSTRRGDAAPVASGSKSTTTTKKVPAKSAVNKRKAGPNEDEDVKVSFGSESRRARRALLRLDPAISPALEGMPSR